MSFLLIFFIVFIEKCIKFNLAIPQKKNVMMEEAIMYIQLNHNLLYMLYIHDILFTVIVNCVEIITEKTNFAWFSRSCSAS